MSMRATREAPRPTAQPVGATTVTEHEHPEAPNSSDEERARANKGQATRAVTNQDASPARVPGSPAVRESANLAGHGNATATPGSPVKPAAATPAAPTPATATTGASGVKQDPVAVAAAGNEKKTEAPKPPNKALLKLPFIMGLLMAFFLFVQTCVVIDKWSLTDIPATAGNWAVYMVPIWLFLSISLILLVLWTISVAPWKTTAKGIVKIRQWRWTVVFFLEFVFGGLGSLIALCERMNMTPAEDTGLYAMTYREAWSPQLVGLILIAIVDLALAPNMTTRAVFFVFEFLAFLQVIFLSVKYDGVVSWTWWGVFSPVWIMFILGAAVIGGCWALLQKNKRLPTKNKQVLAVIAMAGVIFLMTLIFFLVFAAWGQGSGSFGGTGVPLLIGELVVMAWVVLALVDGRFASISKLLTIDAYRMLLEIPPAKNKLNEGEKKTGTAAEDFKPTITNKTLAELEEEKAKGGHKDDVLDIGELTHEPLYIDLKEEKEILQHKLYEYQRDFKKKTGRDLASAEDRAPVKEEYERYQEIKQALKLLEEEYVKHTQGEANSYIHILNVAYEEKEARIRDALAKTGDHGWDDKSPAKTKI